MDASSRYGTCTWASVSEVCDERVSVDCSARYSREELYNPLKQAGECLMMKDTTEVKRRARALTLRLFEADLSDSERAQIGIELRRIVPDPAYTDYIFYPHRMGLEDGTIDDVIDRAVERAFQYKPIVV